AEHQGLGPIRHGEIRVEALRLAERALRFRVVEGEGKPQALVEVRLRLRVRRADLEGERAQPFEEGDVTAGGLHRLRLEGLRLGLGEDQVLQERGLSAGGGYAGPAGVVLQEWVVDFCAVTGGDAWGDERGRSDAATGREGQGDAA